jgi:predicted Na+-dependent transporter
MMSLFSLVLPITLGMWIRYRFTKGAKFMKAVIVPFTLITVLFIFTVRHMILSSNALQIIKIKYKLNYLLQVGMYINRFIFLLMTWQMVVAGFLVAFCGYTFGAGFAWLCG